MTDKKSKLLLLWKAKYDVPLEQKGPYVCHSLIDGTKTSRDEIFYFINQFTKYIDSINQEDTLLGKYLVGEKKLKKYTLHMNSNVYHKNEINICDFNIKALTVFDSAKKIMKKKNKLMNDNNLFNYITELNIDIDSFGKNINLNEVDKALIEADFVYSFYKWSKTNCDINIIDKVFLTSSNNARYYVYELLVNNNLQINEKVELLCKIKNSQLVSFKTYALFKNNISYKMFNKLDELILDLKENKYGIDEQTFKEAQMSLLLLGSPQGMNFADLLEEKELLKNYFELWNRLVPSLSESEKVRYKEILSIFRLDYKKHESKYVLLNINNYIPLKTIEFIFNSENMLNMHSEALSFMQSKIDLRDDKNGESCVVSFNFKNMLKFLDIESASKISVVRCRKHINQMLSELINENKLMKDYEEVKVIIGNDLLQDTIDNSMSFELEISDKKVVKNKDLLIKNIETVQDLVIKYTSDEILKEIIKSNSMGIRVDNNRELFGMPVYDSLDLPYNYSDGLRRDISNKLSENNLMAALDMTKIGEEKKEIRRKI